MRRLLLCSGLVLLFLAAGCTNFDYVGQKFQPTPESEPVEYFPERGQVPPGEYRIIGRATLTALDGMMGYDVRERLLQEARVRGADAVCQVRARKLDVGFYDREDPDPVGAQKPLDPANIDFKGAPDSSEAEKAEYGAPVALRGETQSRKQVVVQALFLKKRTATAPATPAVETVTAPATPAVETAPAPATPAVETAPAPATPAAETATAPATPAVETAPATPAAAPAKGSGEASGTPDAAQR